MDDPEVRRLAAKCGDPDDQTSKRIGDLRFRVSSVLVPMKNMPRIRLRGSMLIRQKGPRDGCLLGQSTMGQERTVSPVCVYT